ncbi:hypothetical protein MTR67_008105 [Solanum verrucosum]|uniref:Uncharacterized protein n=1 Tax=Solanum verrucosum TaxID=315347 RepID=A0AAF0Q383_SOLVR|nr:hypothetical protein MTR67_008105 [Solanum verrucosum]
MHKWRMENALEIGQIDSRSTTNS